MKKLVIYFIITVSFTFSIFSQSMNDFSETNNSDAKSDSVNAETKLRPVLGLAVGDPAFVNLFFVLHFDIITLKITGSHLSNNTNGIQADLGIKFYSNNRLYHALTFGVGNLENDIIQRSLKRGWRHSSWEYYSFNYIFGYRGLMFSPGLSFGEGSFESPHFLIQIGYGFEL